ncbi:MAG: hypothetical protein GY757_62025, partial [bacterium]|nr:hypothetical protein [bacterium]
MAEVLFPVSLSSLIKDYDKTFWDGKGSVSITLNELAQIIEGNPKVTLALLKQQRDQLGKSPVVYSGLKIAAAAETPVSLGDKQNLSLKLSFDAEVNGGLTIILNPEGLKQLPEELGDNLNALLSRYVSLSGEEGVLFLFLTGALSAGVEGSNMLSPALNVGFHFEAGAGFECGHCLPVAGEAQLLQAISDVFSGIRLPQTSLMHLKNKGRPVGLGKNELLYSSYNGFLSLGVNATFSYSFNGTKNVSLGKLDLATKLIVQAEAALSLDYQMAGAFRISVRMGDTPEWLRVVVEKVHSSTFDFAFGVTAGAQLITPETGSGGLALIESVIGTKPAQILHKALEYGSTSIQQWRQKADYFTQALAEKWAGKGVDTVFAAIDDDSLEIIFGAMQKVETAINDIDDDLVSLYEELIDNEGLPGFLDDLRALFQQADPALQKQKLLDIIKNKEINQMVETLAGQAVGSIYTQCENLHQYLQKRFLQLDELVNGGVKKEIREFVAAKKSALHLDSLVTELAKYDSPTKMKSHATTAAKGLVERLLDKPFDSIFVEQGLAARLVGE